MKKPCKLIKFNDGYMLVNDELFGKGDTVYTNEKGKSVIGQVEKVLIGKFAMVDIGGVVQRFFHCRKVLARDSDISFVDTRISDTKRTNQMFRKSVAEELIKNKVSCFVDVDDKGNLIKQHSGRLTLFVSKKDIY